MQHHSAGTGLVSPMPQHAQHLAAVTAQGDTRRAGHCRKHPSNACPLSGPPLTGHCVLTWRCSMDGTARATVLSWSQSLADVRALVRAQGRGGWTEQGDLASRGSWETEALQERAHRGPGGYHVASSTGGPRARGPGRQEGLSPLPGWRGGSALCRQHPVCILGSCGLSVFRFVSRQPHPPAVATPLRPGPG